MVSTGLHRCRCPMASTPAVATDSSGSALSASRRLLHIYIPYTYTIYCVYRYRYYPNIPYIYEYNIIPIRLVTRNFLRFLFATCLETSWNHAFASCGKAVWGQWDAKALKAPDCNWNTFEYLADQTANQEVANCENAPDTLWCAIVCLAHKRSMGVWCNADWFGHRNGHRNMAFQGGGNCRLGAWPRGQTVKP